MGPLFRQSHQRSTIHDQRAFYRKRGKVFAPPNKVGFTPHWRKGKFGEVWRGRRMKSMVEDLMGRLLRTVGASMALLTVVSRPEHVVVVDVMRKTSWVTAPTSPAWPPAPRAPIA